MTIHELPKLLTVARAAEILSIGESTVYQLIQTGELECVRMGRSIRLDPEDLLRFISDRKDHGNGLPRQA